MTKNNGCKHDALHLKPMSVTSQWLVAAVYKQVCSVQDYAGHWQKVKSMHLECLGM